MPIYEYTCQACQNQFEILLRGGQHPQCPNCDSDQLRKQFSVPASPVSRQKSLPVCPTPSAACGRPECGAGGCQFE